MCVCVCVWCVKVGGGGGGGGRGGGEIGVHLFQNSLLKTPTSLSD